MLAKVGHLGWKGFFFGLMPLITVAVMVNCEPGGHVMSLP